MSSDHSLLASSRTSITRSRLLRTSLLCAVMAVTMGAAHALSPRADLGDGYIAGAVGEVSIVERATGRILPIYRHDGELWVAGRPGANYAVRIRNLQDGRILSVISVDGVNAITGKTASARPKDGYVLGAGDSYDVTGWRKSNDNVAAFYFSESDMSYAARTGRPQDVGVIGVALFREKEPEIVYEAPPYRSNSSRLDESKSMAEAPVAADAAASTGSARSAEKRAPAATKPAPSLGTGHGKVESSQVTTVDFEAATQRAAQLVRIRYDSYANLVAKGVIPQPRPRPVVPRTPRAFPGDEGFVPDPPRN